MAFGAIASEFAAVNIFMTINALTEIQSRKLLELFAVALFGNMAFIAIDLDMRAR